MNVSTIVYDSFQVLVGMHALLAICGVCVHMSLCVNLNVTERLQRQPGKRLLEKPLLIPLSCCTNFFRKIIKLVHFHSTTLEVFCLGVKLKGAISVISDKFNNSYLN